MRTDVTIDGRYIPCPNATRLGFCKWRAQVGDLIVYDECGDHLRMARVLGRIAYAPALEGDKGPIKGWALVMALSEDGSLAYERWVDPAKIKIVIESPAKFAAFFFAPKLPYDAHTMRRLMEHGTMSEQYVEHAAERAAMFKKRDKDAAVAAEEMRLDF